MATIGATLTTPESGWSRYDNTDTRIVYSGTWIYEPGSHYNSTSTASTLTSSKITFNFYGTKIRIISPRHPDFPSDANINIDGINYTFSENNGFLQYRILCFEKINLPEQFHSVVISFTSKKLAFDAIDIDDTGYMSTPVGQQLLAPESGWQRLDDTNTKIAYSGTWTRYSDPHYNGSLNESNIYGDTIKFNFYGTMLRIIYAKASNRDSNIIITIDGIQYNYNPYNSTLLYQIIVFEKIGLDLKVHNVVITKGTNSATYFGLDAIDIDSSGYLIDSTPQINSPLKTLINNNMQMQLTATSVWSVYVGNLLKYQVSVVKPDGSIVIKRAYDSTFQSNPLTFETLIFNATEFGIGINNIYIDMTDNQNPPETARYSMTVTKSPTLKILIQDGVKWKYVNGGILETAITDYTSDTLQNKETAFLTNGMGTTITFTPTLNTQIENPTNFKVVAERLNLLS